MPTKALYFPYIAVPEDEWFTRALLYWDSVGTILPDGLEKDPHYVPPRMQELLEAELLVAVHPGWYLDGVPGFKDTFLDFLDHDEDVQARQDRSLDELSLVKVHVQKFGELAEALTKRSLARPLDKPSFEGRVSEEKWLEVEARTADLYMAYLAGVLGSLDQLAMDPLTNRSESISALFGTDTQTDLTLRRARELRIGVLDGLLPAPSASVPVTELKSFKKNHAAQLAAFRDRVDGALIEVGSIEGADARAERARILRDELVRERDAIVAAMEARRWPGIAFGAVAGVVGAAAAVTAPFFVGGGVMAAALAAPGLVPAAYTALNAVQRRPDLGRKPVAYAALAQSSFAAAT